MTTPSAPAQWEPWPHKQSCHLCGRVIEVGERFVFGRSRHAGWAVMCAARDTDCWYREGDPRAAGATGFVRTVPPDNASKTAPEGEAS